MVKVLACFFIWPVENPVFGSNMGRIFLKRNYSTHVRIPFILRGAIFERLARLPSLDWSYPTTAVAFFLNSLKGLLRARIPIAAIVSPKSSSSIWGIFNFVAQRN